MINFYQELNKEHNSLYKIVSDDTTIYLSQKDLEILIRQINNKSDIVNEITGVQELKDELKETSDQLEEIQSKLNNISCIIDD